MPTSSRVIRLAVTCLAALSAACTPADTGQATSATTRDSAGVHIVEYPATPQPTHSITLSSEPLLRHGHRDGDYLFQTVWTGALQPDGGVVIGDGRNIEVVLIGPDGELRSVLASTGEGPSEVRRVMSVMVLGQDTIVVEDDGNGKHMVFEDGVLVRTVPTAGDFALNVGLRTMGVDSRSRLLMTSSAYMPGFEEPWLQGHMVVFDLDGSPADTVGSYDWVRSVGEGESANPFGTGGRPAVSGGSFVYGRSDIPELTWWGTEGGVQQILRWAPEREYPTARHWDAFESSLRADYPRNNPGRSEAELAPLIERSLARYEVRPEEPLPLYTEIHGDRDGGVWLSAFVPGSPLGSFPSYDVIAPDGIWLGAVEAPAGFRLLDVAGDRVLGVLTDELGVESVAVFGLTMPPLEARSR